MACVPTVPTISVCPSGADLATASAAIEPPAPPRLSTTMVAFTASPSICANGRDTMSVAPPGGNGTTRRICLPASDCAAAGVTCVRRRAPASAAASSKSSLRRIGIPVTTSSRRANGSARGAADDGCVRRDDSRSLLRGALYKGLAALHLVVKRRLVDLDHDRVRIDAEVFHQRLCDVAHHADLLFFGAAGVHAYGNLEHPRFFLVSSRRLSWPSMIPLSNKTWMPGTSPGMTS